MQRLILTGNHDIMRITPKRGCCLGGSLCVFIFGVALALSASSIIKYIMRTQVTLGPNSPAEPFWEAIPAPLITKVFLFNVSNPDAIKSEGAKPILKEMGPYVFDEWHKKTKITWNDHNDTVTYQQIRQYFIDKFQSDRDLDKPVTIINAPGATLGALVKPMSAFERGLVNLGIASIKEKLFTTQTPRDIVFDGYSDPLLDAAKILAGLGVHFPGQMDKFAIFYQRNNSDWYDGVFNMFTGKNNLSLANKMYTWNCTRQTVFFPGKCSEVRGNAELFTPLEGPQEFVELYSNDLCRPMRLHNVGETKVGGVSGIRYEMFPSMFANRSVNEDNWCFDGGRQWPSGVFNASACRFGAPAFLSQPHFFQADPYYVDQFAEGSVSPNARNHSTYFVIEPTSGLPMEVVARFQVNIFIEPIPELSMFKNLKKPIFFPAFWFETRMSLAGDMKTGVWILSNLQTLLLGMGLATSLLVVAILVVIYIYHSAAKKPSPVRSDATGQTTDNSHSDGEDDVTDNSVGPLIPPDVTSHEHQYTSTPKQ